MLATVVLAAFWPAILGGIFYFGDIYQLHYPLRSVYAQELARLALPLWTPNALAGYPLVAEGQLGALYPINLVLHLLLPVPLALNVFVLGHFVIAAIGAYSFARRVGLRRMASLFSGVVYALSGFLIAHLNHVNIIACAAWLPWLFLLTDRAVVGVKGYRSLRDWVLLAVVIAMELLAGHPQIALLSLLSAGAYGLYLIWSTRQSVVVCAGLFVPLVLGVALAAPQILTTAELTGLSARSGGLDPSFFASFSMHPAYLVHLVSPFVLGNPYPAVSVELVGYVGWLPLLLALGSLIVIRRQVPPASRAIGQARFFVALAVVALILSLGRWNPLYMVLARLPVFNLFRVPARYLYLFTFGVAVLAGTGLDALLSGNRRPLEGDDGNLALVVMLAIEVAVSVGIALTLSLDGLLEAWRWLPVALGILAAAWIAGSLLLKGTHSLLWGTLALVLVIIDLGAFGAVYSRTYNQTISLAEFAEEPRSLAFFRSTEGVYRVYTQEQIVPVLSVMRESMYPNLSLIHGLSAVNGQFPLVPRTYTEYVSQMTPGMLNLLGVRYYAIPQVLPVDEESEFYDLENPFALNPVDRQLTIPATLALTLEVESYISHSVDWPDGQAVAELLLTNEEGQESVFVLRAGWHTAEWAYARSDVLATVRHAQPPIVRSWAARSGFPPEGHAGSVYLSRFRLAGESKIVSVQVKALVPMAYLRIERLVLVDPQNRKHNLAHLMGMGDHTLAYRSEDVAIYENHDALPRAFWVREARAVSDDHVALTQLRAHDFDPRSVVLLASDESVPAALGSASGALVELLTYDNQRIVVRVRSEAEGYLVLADSWYPGWRALVNGQESPIYRADMIFRAVAVPAGESSVEFVYRPASFDWGLRLAAGAVAGLFLLWWVSDRSRRSSDAVGGSRST